MQHLEGSGTPVLYIGRTVLKGYYETNCNKKVLLKSHPLTDQAVTKNVKFQVTSHRKHQIYVEVNSAPYVWVC